MDDIDWFVLALLLILIIDITVGTYLIINELSNQKKYKKACENLNVSLTNALLTYFQTDDYEQCIFEIDILFKNIIVRNEILSNQYVNVVVLLENYIHKINDNTINLKEIDKNAFKREIKGLIDEYTKRNPLEQIKGMDFVVLNELIKCLERGEIEEGKKVINQIAVEINNLRNINTENEKTSKKQALIGKVGIVLSCVFGVMTFVQFFI